MLLQVMEQAYLYRMVSTINMDRTPLLGDESSELAAVRQRNKVKMFCQSMSEIERLRSDLTNRLKKKLRVDSFPSACNISDPSLMPFLSSRVRAVVEAFPLQAEEIVKKYGLETQEFNKMLSESRSNPLFRWRVEKEIRNASQQNSK